MTNTTCKMTVLALVGLGIWVGNVRADNAQLNDKLRQDLAIKLEDVTIAQALDQIGQKAGVKIALSPEAVWKLPEGEQTRLSVTLEGRLAESLEKMLNSFFLRYAVGPESLTIYPRPELKHIIGRPTAAELNLLRNIYSNAVWASTSTKGISDGFVQQVLNGLAKESVTIMPPNEMNTTRAVMYAMMTKSTSSSGSPHDPNTARKERAPLTIAALMEGIEQAYKPPKTWYIEGATFPRQVSEIRIVSQEEFWQAHLDQTVDVSFTNETGEAIVTRLAAWADLSLRFPGDGVPAALDRPITVEVQNAKLIDILDKALSTLSVNRTINISEGAVELTVPPAAMAHDAARRPRPEVTPGEGYIGKISIPMEGGRYFIEFMLRESDLPEPLRKLRQEAMSQVITTLSSEGKMQEVLKQLSSTSTQTK
jgi:hypothetical protein